MPQDVPQTSKRPLVLIVENERTVRGFCDTSLRHHGFDTVLAAHGEEGLDVFLARHDEIALVLLDLSAPRINGIQLANIMLALRPGSQIILMSAFAPELEIPMNLQRECTLLAKPLKAVHLLEAVSQRLGTRISTASV